MNVKFLCNEIMFILWVLLLVVFVFVGIFFDRIIINYFNYLEISCIIVKVLVFVNMLLGKKERVEGERGKYIELFFLNW